jgi:hypothetical protein
MGGLMGLMGGLVKGIIVMASGPSAPAVRVAGLKRD